MKSIARSGVLTSIAPKVSSQLRAISASKASRSAARMARTAARASSRVAASPRKKTTSAALPGGNSNWVRIAAQGSKAAPTLLDIGDALASAAGFASVRLRPMNSRRSPVQSRWAPHISAKATREPKTTFDGLRAKSAPVWPSISVSTKARVADLDEPSTHSINAVTLRWRVRFDAFAKRRRDILTDPSTGTY